MAGGKLAAGGERCGQLLIHICFYFSSSSLSRGLGPPELECKGLGEGRVVGRVLLDWYYMKLG